MAACDEQCVFEYTWHPFFLGRPTRRTYQFVAGTIVSGMNLTVFKGDSSGARNTLPSSSRQRPGLCDSERSVKGTPAAEVLPRPLRRLHSTLLNLKGFETGPKDVDAGVVLKEAELSSVRSRC